MGEPHILIAIKHIHHPPVGKGQRAPRISRLQLAQPGDRLGPAPLIAGEHRAKLVIDTDNIIKPACQRRLTGHRRFKVRRFPDPARGLARHGRSFRRQPSGQGVQIIRNRRHIA
ncbi:hypothetical protein MKI84_12880 [Ancylobacter sp. A5.8]|uniref:hypothetical protein n=1 Tax=Ancylobacter gelatini TaxID=2919920 RepID=UPI001F4E53BD|nr:hypothetical protein [Ancylobacter gelatini]MCJ8143811.1 hypothetical protein [Ancylobacter gelatini]